MKKVIDGKRYDTDTAQVCGECSYGYPGDFNHVSETLYMKRTGEFFLYGEGGPRSKYAESVSMNEWTGGERITPLTEDEAKAWAEENLTGEEYEEIFTVEEPEDGKKIQSFSLSGKTIQKLTCLSRKHKVSRSSIIEELVKKAE